MKRENAIGNRLKYAASPARINFFDQLGEFSVHNVIPTCSIGLLTMKHLYSNLGYSNMCYSNRGYNCEIL